MPTPMETLLANVASVTTTIFNIVTTCVSTITNNPLLLVFFTIGVVGAGIGLFQRLR